MHGSWLKASCVGRPATTWTASMSLISLKMLRHSYAFLQQARKHAIERTVEYQSPATLAPTSRYFQIGFGTASRDKE